MKGKNFALEVWGVGRKKVTSEKILVLNDTCTSKRDRGQLGRGGGILGCPMKGRGWVIVVGRKVVFRGRVKQVGESSNPGNAPVNRKIRSGNGLEKKMLGNGGREKFQPVGQGSINRIQK